MDGLDFLSGNLEVKHFVAVDAALLNKGPAADDDEEFPLGVVPMLPLGDAGLGDVDAELAAAKRLDKFGE